MIVDAILVSVESTNFDALSFAINDEANLNIYFSRMAIYEFFLHIKASANCCAFLLTLE